MDRFIASMPAVPDGDLMLCKANGVAYQKDMTNLVAYDDEYYEKCRGYEDQVIANKINAGRVALVRRHIGFNALVDVGIGSGEFLRKRGNTWGHDVNPVAIEWLKRNDLWTERLSQFAGVSMWDVLEHVPEPEKYLRQIPLHGFLFVSIPLFYAIGAVRTSKHYRPGEHLYYFEEEGFLSWMEMYGFRVAERSDFEIEAGRESIFSFAFRRTRWSR